MDNANTTTYSWCLNFYNFYQLYLELSFAVISIFLNTACVAVFVSIIRDLKNDDDLFKYLLFKSVADTYVSMAHVLGFFFSGSYTNVLGVDKFYVFLLFYLIFGYYFSFSLQLISVFSDIVASFNRYRTSINKFKIWNKLSYKLVILTMCVYSFAFYIYKLVSLDIVIDSGNSSIVKYAITPNKLDKTMGYIHSIVRDGICVLIIILLNVLTALVIKSLLAKKKHLTTKKSMRLKIANIRLSLMVFTVSILASIGHGLTLIVSSDYIKASYFFGHFNTFN